MRCCICASENPASKTFCGDCGARLTNVCPKCAAENPPRKRFCADCGTALNHRPAIPIADSSQSSFSFGIGPDPASGYIAADGERKTVTALFADIQGSTELMESRDPEEARGIVDPVLRIMMEAVRHYDGYVVQTTGDGIFALFGAPAAYEDHAQRGLFAALKMQQEIREYARRLLSQGHPVIETRVGINTGEVVVRTFETGGRTEYTPIGYTTNLASRLQTLAPAGSVVASDFCRRLTEGYFVFRPLGAQQVKGVREPVDVYEVLGPGTLRTHFQLLEQRGLTKFVGRAQELAELKTALKSATDGNGCVLGIVAEAGAGKSRLIHEFQTAIPRSSRTLRAYSVSHGKASSYLPLVELLQHYFDFAEHDDAPTRGAKVQQSIVELDPALARSLTYLLPLLGLEQVEEPLAQMDAQLRRRRTLEALVQLFLRESQRQPLVAIFEDLHWIDQETQALLDLLVERSTRARILLLVSYRPEYHHDWANHPHYQELRLDPLPPSTAGEMIASLLSPAFETPRDNEPPIGSTALSTMTGPAWLAKLSRLIMERTDGNPLFIEEMVQALIEQGVLRRSPEIYLLEPIEEIKVPTTVNAILASRIDRLPPSEKNLLQILAVLGVNFTLTLVRRVTAASSDLEPMLDALEAGAFIRKRDAAAPEEYTFKHALTQEVAYGSVLIEQRRNLHERIAGAIEAEFGDRLNDHLRELAHHYGRSANRSKAVEYLYRAGLDAEQRSAYAEAVSYHKRAVELITFLDDGLERTGRELSIQIALGNSLRATKGFSAEEVGRVYTRARQLCSLAGDTAPLFAILYGEFLFYYWKMDQRKALEVAQELLAEAQRINDPARLLTAHFALGIDLAHLDELLAARDHLEKAVTTFDPGQSLPLEVELQRVVSFGYLGLTLIALGYPDQGRNRVREMMGIALRSRDAFILSNGLCVTPLAEMYCGNGPGMKAQADALAATAEEHGFGALLPLAAGYRAAALILQDCLEQGICELRRSISATRAAGGTPFGWAFRMLGYGLAKAGRIHEGLEVIDEALDSPAKASEAQTSPHLHHVKGMLLAQIPSRAEEANASFCNAIAGARRQGARLAELRATVSLARLLAQQGNRQNAHHMLAGIFHWFTEGFDLSDLKEAQALLEDLTST